MSILKLNTAVFGSAKDKFLFQTAEGEMQVLTDSVEHNAYFCRPMKNSQVNIRKGRKQDVNAVFELIKELALYEKAPEQVTLTLEQLEEDGFGSNPIYGLFVAEKDGTVIGIALYYEKYSTWQGRCIYLEDIIVTESERGNGIGHQLFQSVIGVAKERNSARMEWQVLDWNEPAINFYKKYNANLDGEWYNGKLTRKQIQDFNGI